MKGTEPYRIPLEKLNRILREKNQNGTSAEDTTTSINCVNKLEEFRKNGIPDTQEAEEFLEGCLGSNLGSLRHIINVNWGTTKLEKSLAHHNRRKRTPPAPIVAVQRVTFSSLGKLDMKDKIIASVLSAICIGVLILPKILGKL